MSGEQDLNKLLKSLEPELGSEEFVFHSIKGSVYGDHVDLEPIAFIMEEEGSSMVITRQVADEKNIEYSASFRRITLKVHSSLEAVGLTAAFSTKLGEHGISANVVAGYYHDHIFVQSKFAHKALAAINELSKT